MFQDRKTGRISLDHIAVVGNSHQSISNPVLSSRLTWVNSSSRVCKQPTVHRLAVAETKEDREDKVDKVDKVAGDSTGVAQAQVEVEVEASVVSAAAVVGTGTVGGTATDGEATTEADKTLLETNIRNGVIPSATFRWDPNQRLIHTNLLA